jgi:hypothetical protein
MRVWLCTNEFHCTLSRHQSICDLLRISVPQVESAHYFCSKVTQYVSRNVSVKPRVIVTAALQAEWISNHPDVLSLASSGPSEAFWS